jgi:hypothetical protein
MPYTTPAAVSSGAVISKTTFGDVVIADLNFLANPPACRVHNSGTQNLANNTEVALTFDSERYDTDTMHSTSSNTSRITATTAGLYLITGHVQITGDTDYISIVVSIRLGGTTAVAAIRETAPGTSANQKMFSIATVYKLAAGNYVELTVSQENTSAGTSTTVVSAARSPEFSATWIGLG